MLALSMLMVTGIAVASHLDEPNMRFTAKEKRIIAFILDHNRKAVKYHKLDSSHLLTRKDAELIVQSARSNSTASFDFETIIAQLKVETDFRPRAVSSVGARGLPQIRYHKWTWYKPFKELVDSPEDLYDPEVAIKAQVVILDFFFRVSTKTRGNHKKTFQRYSGYAKDYYTKVLLETLKIKQM